MDKDMKKIVQAILDFNLDSSQNDDKKQPPPMYNIWLMKDSLIPEDFLVKILQQYFHLENAKINEILSKITQHGQALCGIYTKDVAETKMNEISNYAMHNNYQFDSIMMQRSFSYAIKRS